MRRPDPDDAAGLGLAMAQRGILLALEFALPVLGGVVLDRRLGTSPTLTLIGSALGFTVGMWHTLRLSRTGGRPGGPRPKPGP